MAQNTLKASTALARAIVESIDNEPERWSLGSYHLIHDSGIRLWTSIGEYYVHDPRNITFTWLDWFRVRSAVKAWKRAHPLPKRDEGADIIRMLRGPAS